MGNCGAGKSMFTDVHKLIVAGKKIFLKSPFRARQFKLLAPNLALPPRPVITLWGTWIEAANYYVINFDEVKRIVESFDVGDSAAIKSAQSYKRASIQAKFLYVNRLNCLTPCVTQWHPLMVSVEVERSFSKLEDILSENLCKHIFLALNN